MSYDIDAVRSLFPSLKAGAVFLDGPGGTQTPQPVIDAITDALTAPLSNLGRSTPGERNSVRLVTEARQAMADLLGGDPSGIVFGRSATQLTYDFSRTLAKTWAPGDEVVVTRLDHDANVRPWVQAAAAAGATVRWADFDPATGELAPGQVAAVLSDRTRLVAVTGASNLIGTLPDIPEISRLTHEAGALLHVDGVHRTPHAFVDVEQLGSDFYVCSSYKFLGPHMGVLAARPGLLETLRPDKLEPSANTVPGRFELGTLPYESLAAVRAAVDFLAGLAGPGTGTRRERLARSYSALEDHETGLRLRLEEALAALAPVTLHSRAAHRTPTLLLSLEDHDTADAYRYLAERGITAPSGSFYAPEASRRLGLGEAGGLRIGLAPYTGAEDVERFLEGLEDFLRTSR